MLVFDATSVVILYVKVTPIYHGSESSYLSGTIFMLSVLYFELSFVDGVTIGYIDRLLLVCYIS